MNNILTVNFWFNMQPPAMLPLFNYLFIALLFIFLALAIFAIIFKTKKKAYKTFWKMFYEFAATNLLIGSIFYFFNYQRAVFLSARFWFIIWFILILVWLFFIIIHYKKIPKKIEKLKVENEYKKYLPK